MRVMPSVVALALIGAATVGAAPVAPRLSGGRASAGAPATRLEVLRLLRARDFATLTRAIEASQAKVERDVRNERELAHLVGSFDTADPTLAAFIEDWVRTRTDSFAPRLARGRYRLALAWNSRGTQFANETSPEQFAGMAKHLEAAVEDAGAALEKNPRVGEAHRIVINAAMALGDRETCIEAAGLGVAALPASMAIRATLASCLLPRWGGAYKLIDALAEEADAHVKENPALKALHGFVDWDLGRVARISSVDKALEYYERALQAGEHWMFYRDRANAYMRKERYLEALEDTTRGLALAGDEPDLLTIRARAFSAAGRHEEALAVVRLIAEIDPTNGGLAALRAHELKNAATQGHERYKSGDFSGAIARLTRGIDLAGGNTQLHYWRGRAYLKLGDHERALSDFESAIRFDVRHFESYRNVDYILAGRHDWPGVVRYWTQYIGVEPNDGRAYLERGGAQYHKGDRAAALADAQKACELGTNEACAVMQRLASSQ